MADLTDREALERRLRGDERNLAHVTGPVLLSVHLPNVTADIAAHYCDALDLGDEELTRQALDLLREARGWWGR
jgi:hypothetical protein